MRKPLLLLGLGAAAVALASMFYATPTRFLGDKAKVGDVVDVTPASLSPEIALAVKTLVDTGGIAETPGSVAFRVTGVGPDVITGELVGLRSMAGFRPFSLPTAQSSALQRAAVVRIERSGQEIRL